MYISSNPILIPQKRAEERQPTSILIPKEMDHRWQASSRSHYQPQLQQQLSAVHHPNNNNTIESYRTQNSNHTNIIKKQPQPYLLSVEDKEDEKQRFELATQPNTIQRKTYKYEHRYLLPNPLIIQTKKDISESVSNAIITAKLGKRFPLSALFSS